MRLPALKSLCHLSSPAVARRIVSNLPPDSDGQSFGNTPRKMRLDIGVHGLATRRPYGCRRHRRHRWALTPPFHPYRPSAHAKKRRSFSVTAARALARLALSPVRRPMLPGLSSPPDSPTLRRRRKQRQSPLASMILIFVRLNYISYSLATGRNCRFLKKAAPKTFEIAYATP